MGGARRKCAGTCHLSHLTNMVNVAYQNRFILSKMHLCYSWQKLLVADDNFSLKLEKNESAYDFMIIYSARITILKPECETFLCVTN